MISQDNENMHNLCANVHIFMWLECTDLFPIFYKRTNSGHRTRKTHYADSYIIIVNTSLKMHFLLTFTFFSFDFFLNHALWCRWQCTDTSSHHANYLRHIQTYYQLHRQQGLLHTQVCEHTQKKTEANPLTPRLLKKCPCYTPPSSLRPPHLLCVSPHMFTIKTGRCCEPASSLYCCPAAETNTGDACKEVMLTKN